MGGKFSGAPKIDIVGLLLIDCIYKWCFIEATAKFITYFVINAWFGNIDYEDLCIKLDRSDTLSIRFATSVFSMPIFCFSHIS